VSSRLLGCPRIVVVFWALALVAIAIWSLVPGYVIGWDERVCSDAIHSLQLGHDPYADGTAVLEEFQRHVASHPNIPQPLIYVYGPITLPLLGWIGMWPVWLAGVSFWCLVAVSIAVTIWIGMRSIEEHERPVFLLLAPAAIFFPGLIQNDALFSGNVAFAYIFYGLVLGAAAVGWRKGHWGWFYAATLLAACFKAPLLTLLAIPLLSARRQWLPAGLTAGAWLAGFTAQWVVWPAESRNYILSLDYMFSLSRDFSSSPAGLLAEALYGMVPYRLVLAAAYLAYAIPTAGILYYLSRRYLSGRISLTHWVPVMLIGVILLNPRIQQYDVAAITIAMALVAWRFLAVGSTPIWVVGMRCAFFFVAANILATYRWRATESLVLVGTFAAGVWCLLRQSPNAEEVWSADEPMSQLVEQEVPA
jgi:hypothetical protein